MVTWLWLVYGQAKYSTIVVFFLEEFLFCFVFLELISPPSYFLLIEFSFYITFISFSLATFTLLSQFFSKYTCTKWSRLVMSNSLWPHMDYNLSVSSDHGIFQAGILEWVAISFSRKDPGRSRKDPGKIPGIELRSTCVAGRCFTIWATREAQ